MKATFRMVLVVAATAGAFAGEAQTGRYLVATRELPHAVSGRFTRTGADIVDFGVVRGFAATLTDAEAQELARDPNVRFVEPDPRRYLDGPRGEGLRAAVPYSHPLPEVGSQLQPYGIGLVQAPNIWRLARGAGIKVGVVDTGIDSRHPDLASNIRGGRSFVGESLPALQDGAGHGTHVAGTIAASDNAEGVVGVAPEAELYSLRVFDESAEFTNASALIEVIDWAIANGIRVLNMSLGGPETSLLERQAFTRAAQNGILIFASSGNDGRRVTNFPAAYDDTIAVGAIDEARTIAGFSTFGSYLDIVGPGVGVLSSVPIDAGIVPLISGDGVPSIAANLMEFSPSGRVTGQYVFCGLGRSDEFPASVSGKIALIRRGDLTFAEKAKNAKAAGAIGVIVFNNAAGGFGGTLGTEPFAWPVTVSVTLHEGEALLAAPPNTSITLDFVQGYEFNQGTSMACPHVAGVAALIWSLRPTASAAEVRDAILKTATDLGPQGWDEKFGFGAVNAFAAAKALAPELFPRARPSRR